MERPWLRSYPPGVPAHIDLGEYSSIVDLLETSCEKYKDRVAYHNMGADLSYAELDFLTRNFAAALQDMGMQPGDRIAMMMPNTLQYPVALFGALRTGLIIVNTNPMYTARELRHQLVDSGAKAIVVVENYASVLESIRDSRFRTATRSRSLAAPTASTEVVFKQARSLLQTWLAQNQNTPVRLLGVGVSGLEEPDSHGLVFDTAQQTALDQTMDRIKRRYGDDKAIRALALKGKNR